MTASSENCSHSTNVCRDDFSVNLHVKTDIKQDHRMSKISTDASQCEASKADIQANTRLKVVRYQ